MKTVEGTGKEKRQTAGVLLLQCERVLLRNCIAFIFSVTKILIQFTHNLLINKLKHGGVTSRASGWKRYNE